MITNIRDVNVFVLCAGKQKRFGGLTSKLMFDVNGQPAIFYTLQTLLSVFCQSTITVITSNLFSDLNQYVRHFFPQIKLVFDDCPGTGTASSFKKGLGLWRSEIAFVTAGDIFYEPSLVSQILQTFYLQHRAKVVIAVTSQVAIAPTHRPVCLEPFTIFPATKTSFVPTHRNIGVYALRQNVKQYFEQGIPGIIDVLTNMQLAGELTVPALYEGVYLHTGYTSDQKVWCNHFCKTP